MPNYQGNNGSTDEPDIDSEITGAELAEEGGQSESGLITIRSPETLKKYGWKEPYPSYVTAAPSLWKLWLDLATREK